MKKPRAKGTGSIFKPKGSSFYWIAYVSGGKRRYESTKSTRSGDAQALLTDRLGDTGKGIVVTPKLGRITLAAGLKAVINDMTMNGRRSIEDTQRQIDLHILSHPATAEEPAGGYFNPDRRMNTITTSDLTAYVSHRLAQGAAAGSCNHELATIRRAFRLALRGNELATMPYIPMMELDNTRTGFFEREVFEAVRAALPEALRGLVTFAYLTGWRVQSEVLPLKWPQVDRTAKTIRLEPGTTKNRDGRTLPYDLLPELVDVIDVRWHEHERLKAADVICPFVFHRNGKPIRDFRGAWEAACTSAGCPDMIVHDTRRTAVRNFERAGVSRSAAMKITGHKTESVYRRYAIVSEGDIREAFGKLASARQPEAESKGKVSRFERRTASQR